MKVSELLKNKDFTLLNEGVKNLDAIIESGYISDLLSWVMSHAKTGCAWITIQTHVNIIAVATLLEMSCIIVPEGEKVEDATLIKAKEEEIPIISTELTSFEVAGFLIKNGVK